MIKLSDLPSEPGCYLFKDSKGGILYVGKAKDLKKRVSSYFQKTDHGSKTKTLVSQIDDVDFIVTDSEVEALILENNLIKKNIPKYNVDLKDSKRFAFIQVTDEEFPRILLSRKKAGSSGSGTYYGPFTSAETRDYIIDMLRKAFKLRTCKKMPRRACLRYHINACTAPCIGQISLEDYSKDVDAARMVLKGKNKEIISSMTRKMKQASNDTKFEYALALRDRIDALDWLSERQKMERESKYDEDIINYMIKKDKVYLLVFNSRRGVLENKQEFEFNFTDNFFEEFLLQFYSENPVPGELILPVKPDMALAQFLKKQKGGAFSITVPQKGEKKQLLDLVLKNVEISFFGDTKKIEDLQDRLNLESMPSVIECFDISHLSGTFTVGSMVQFRNAKPDKSNYRRFKIRSVDGVDDYKAIGEVVLRRYSRLLKERADLPDLIVIDGGLGQLNSALKQLGSLGLQLPVISLAKQFEEIYVPGLEEPIRLDKKTAALKLLQEVRDEAHRFAINYNRLLRKREVTNEA